MFINYKKKEGVISFSNNIIISEINNNEIKIFQKIDANADDIFDFLSLYVKKLKTLFITIELKEEYFKILEIDIEQNEVGDDELKTYIEYSVKENLYEDSLDDYFIKHFKVDNNKFKVFIFKRNFIEELIGFIIKNNLKIKNIVIHDSEDFLLHDYDKIIKNNKNNKNLKFLLFYVFFILLFSLGIKFYNSKIENKINSINKKIYLKNEKINDLKFKQEDLEKEISFLNSKLNSSLLKKQKFKTTLYYVLSLMSEDMRISSVFYEKKTIILKGNTKNKNSIFDFLNCIETNKNFSKISYDYIINEKNIYQFSIEIKVI